MSRFAVGNVFLVLSMICTAVSQLMVKPIMDEVGADRLGAHTLGLLLEGSRPWRGGLAVLLLGGGFVFWMLALTRLNLSYAYPIACSSVLLVAFLSAVVLGEPVTARTWFGTVLVLIGIALLTPAD